jgi:hypothetical protein
MALTVTIITGLHVFGLLLFEKSIAGNDIDRLFQHREIAEPDLIFVVVLAGIGGGERFTQFSFRRVGQDMLDFEGGEFFKRPRSAHALERHFYKLSQLGQQVPRPVLLHRAQRIALRRVRQLPVLGRHILLEFLRDELVQPLFLLLRIRNVRDLAQVICPKREVPLKVLCRGLGEDVIEQEAFQLPDKVSAWEGCSQPAKARNAG